MSTKKKPSEPRKTLAMTINHSDGSKTEIHTLNPGEAFEGFGGSSRPLVVMGKTASIITRTTGVGISDYERDIYDPNFWEWIAKLINNSDGTAAASMPDKKGEEATAAG